MGNPGWKGEASFVFGDSSLTGEGSKIPAGMLLSGGDNELFEFLNFVGGGVEVVKEDGGRSRVDFKMEFVGGVDVGFGEAQSDRFDLVGTGNFGAGGDGGVGTE